MFTDTHPPRVRLVRDTLTMDGQEPVGANLTHDEPVTATDATVWLRTNQGPINIGHRTELAASELLRGHEMVTAGAVFADTEIYATIHFDGARWRVNLDGTVIEAPIDPPRPDDPIPDPLPADIGTVRYVNAYGFFRPVSELTVDDIEPRSDYVDRQEITRQWRAAELENVQGWGHFLFGKPGVRADPDRFIYHYTKLDTLAAIAGSRSLRLSKFIDANDPREFRPWLNHTFLTEGRGLGPDNGPTPADEDAARAFMEEIDQLRLRTYAIAFARDQPRRDPDPVNLMLPNDPPGFLKQRMWEQYGDKHTGACLILDRHRFDQAASAALTDGHAHGAAITYTRDDRDLVNLTGYYRAGRRNDPLATLIDEQDIRLFAKDPDWRDENEYRWIYLPDDPTSPNPFVPIDGALVGLVIGDKIELDDSRVVDFTDAFSIRANYGRCAWRNPRDHGINMPRLAP